jgi:NAD(P)H-dependent flavin oxidoreductase YrpB (nitropropane dioxygenase family)
MSRPTLRTASCDRVGVEVPVVLAGMGPVAGTGEPVATAELVAAVSNAGGLGVMGGVAYPPDVLRREIRRVRKPMRNVSNPLIEAWEREGLEALPMGAQATLIRDLLHSVREAGRHELLMNAAGQTSGMLTKRRAAAEILADMVAEAAEILASGLARRVRASA